MVETMGYDVLVEEVNFPKMKVENSRFQYFQGKKRRKEVWTQDRVVKQQGDHQQRCQSKDSQQEDHIQLSTIYPAPTTP